MVTTSYSKKRSVQMFCCNAGPPAPHMKPFQPEPPFILRAHKPETRVSHPKKGGRGSELESPLLLKAQGQGMQQHRKSQNAKPTQLQPGDMAPENPSSAAKLLRTAGPPQAPLRKPLRAAWHAAPLRGGIQGDVAMLLHAIGSSPGYSWC